MLTEETEVFIEKCVPVSLCSHKSHKINSALASICNINRSVFLMEEKHILCAVRNKYLYVYAYI